MPSNRLTPIQESEARRKAAEEAKKAKSSCQPGTHWTDRVEKIMDRESAGKSNPSQITGDPDDFGQAVAFLCSEQARFITGTGLLVDGGQAAGLLD